MLSGMAYHFLQYQRLIVVMMQNAARRTPGSLRSPAASALPFPWTMMPVLNNPMMAMKNPIPADIAIFREAGMELTMLFLRPVTVTTKKIRPERNTTIRPCS